MKGRFEGVHEKVCKGSKWVSDLSENIGGWTVSRTSLSSVLSNWKMNDLFNRVTCSPRTQKISVIQSALFWESSHFIILTHLPSFWLSVSSEKLCIQYNRKYILEKRGKLKQRHFQSECQGLFLRCSVNTHAFWKRRENFFAVLAFSCIYISCVGNDKLVLRNIAKIMHHKVQH